MQISRRSLLSWGARGLAGGIAARWLAPVARAAEGGPRVFSEKARVALASGGDSRAGNILDALRRIEPDIRKGLARRKGLLVKPNLVSTLHPLSVTKPECLDGLLEFFRPLVKGEILIAESTASAPASEAFDQYGYRRLEKQYGARLIDLDTQPHVIRHVVDHRYRPHAVRFSRLLMDPDLYVVSVTVMKTHDRAVVTLSLKNLVVGGLLKDETFRWSDRSRGRNDKVLVHGGPANEAIHYNMFSLALLRQPDLAVIDGWVGMEHNGPVLGEPVDHKVAVAGTDWLAADRVAVELMGFDFAKVGYLTFCAQAGMGQADLERIEILGGRISDLARRYRPHDNIEQQYKWMA